MGEIADSLINGEFDYITGEYIGKPVGYPRSMYEDDKPNRKGKVSFCGVIKYLLIAGYSDPFDQQLIITEYRGGVEDLKISCDIIQRDFKSFAKFIKSKKHDHR